MPKKAELSLPRGTKVPNHIVIIPDGNRRWARARGLPDYKGHQEGALALAKVLEASRKLGVHTATFWGLSTENWRERNEKEIKVLMKTISSGIDRHLDDAKKQGVRVVHLGRKDRLPSFLLKRIEKVEEETRNNTKHVFNIALDYGGQDEIVRAVQKLIDEGVPSEKVDKELMDKYMDTADQPYPYPDLIIRTSGEQRTSGILLWQSHYAETYWEPDHFPSFTPEKLREAILDYSRRRRRFGGNDAVEHLKFRPEVTANLELAWWRLRKIPEGTRFKDYAIEHLKEQYGLSKKLATEAAKLMAKALIEGRESNWERAKRPLKGFYKLIKDELKLAFEPSLAASLEVKLWEGMGDKESVEAAGEIEETAKKLYAEVYRISLFQAAKIAHLMVMAQVERNLAERGRGEHHWDKAEDYLEKFYAALKERVA
ncbi:MAG: polyprenyl diphosphate synthase [Patescibacteria group bacterium]